MLSYQAKNSTNFFANFSEFSTQEHFDIKNILDEVGHEEKDFQCFLYNRSSLC